MIIYIMKNLNEILSESIFDVDSLDNTEHLDFSWIKTKNMNIKAEIFYAIMLVMMYKGYYDEDTIEFYVPIYKKHKYEIDALVKVLKDAFKKQGYESWFIVSEEDFEDMGEEMTDEEIDHYNDELKQFFEKSAITGSMNERFLIDTKQIPDFIINIMKGTKYWDNRLKKSNPWAVTYEPWDDHDQVMCFYGCPKTLSSYYKKLLYN